MNRVCFHCAEPIPPDVHLHVVVGGATHAVCCIGCQAASEWIGTLGLDDYYRLRAEPAERAGVALDYSAWDRAQLQRLYVRERADGRREVCVLVQGMRCTACSWLIERALRAAPGCVDVGVNVAAKRVQLVWDPDASSLGALLERLARLGYTPHPLDAASLDALNSMENRRALKRLLVAGLGMMQSMMYAVALYAGAFEGMDAPTRDFFRWLGLLVCAPVILYAGAPFFLGAVRELTARRLGMDTPVALAIALVFVASLIETLRGGAQVYFDSASMFVFLLLGARQVELYGRQRAADVVDALARLQPATAQRRVGERLETVGTHELTRGDVVVVEAGQTVPADGVLLDPQCLVDESLLTGESTPRRRAAGERLLAGTLLRSGPVGVRVSEVGADTVLSAIVRLVGRAQQQRPRWTRFADAIAARFVAGVLLLTALTAAAWLAFDPSRAFAASLAVLVVSCPCAFALAVPAATTRAVAVLAREGVLVLAPDALEKLLAVTRVVFDKTGTLSTRQMELVDTQPLGALAVSECLALAAALEIASTHPIAESLRHAAHGLPQRTATDLLTVAGAGVEGTIDGRRLRLGRTAFAWPAAADDRGVLLADAHGPLARFVLREQVRADAAPTLAALAQDGLALEILSGDDAAHVAAIAQRLGIERWHARCTPEAKLAELERVRAGGDCVAMVGDGINDAPVLAGADLSVALGGGAQLAQSSADLVLAGDRLDALVTARRVAQRTARVLRQNVIWAAAYNFLSIPLAAVGLVPPWLAAIGMSLSSLFVVLNSLRIRRPARAPHAPEQATASLPRGTEALPA